MLQKNSFKEKQSIHSLSSWSPCPKTLALPEGAQGAHQQEGDMQEEQSGNIDPKAWLGPAQ